MGDFAVNAAIGYQIGTARGNFSVLSAMDITPVGFFAKFGDAINDLILAHRGVLEQKRKLDVKFTWQRSAVGPKSRWVDGTPEYSLHICGLRKLFPDALFIHLVRDVDAVVRSLLNFHRVSGTHLVASEEEAYRYWLRRVEACLKAEQAYGPEVVHRLLYSSLVNSPDMAMQSLLGFVGEPYSAACLEPLGERINSSSVPADFRCDDPATDPVIVDQARRLSAQIEKSEQPKEPSDAAADELEIAFQQSCLRARTIEKELITQIAKQEQHYTAAFAQQETNYTYRLGKQLREMQRVVGILDQLAAIAASLQSSRFWTFANKAAAIEAKLFRNKDFVPARRFQEVLARFSKWRASHPQIANPDGSGRQTESPLSVKSSDAVSENQAIQKTSGNSANA
jgi:hypothetical protein